MRKALTVKAVENAKPKAKRYFLRDGISPLSIRILPSGFKSCGLGPTRFPGSPNPTFRSWGAWDGTLEGHRDKARKWLDLVRRGIDPAIEVERERQAELKRAAGTFRATAEEFIAKRVTPEKMSRWRDVKLDIERELIPRWGDRLIAEISRHDVVLLCEDFEARGHIARGHQIFGRGRAIFNWLIQRGATDSSPFDRVEVTKLIGARKSRSRTLTDAEIRALWKITAKLPYPTGPFVKMLLITGQRRGEVVGMRWSEIDHDRALWIIPEARMKGDRPHVVPLSPMALDVLVTMKRKGDRVFEPFHFSVLKQKIDKLLAAELKIPPFVLHDLRRTVRSRLSSITNSDVAELVIAHSLQGLRKVYDHHDFLKEKTDALNAWANVLRAIVEPPPANVVQISEGAVMSALRFHADDVAAHVNAALRGDVKKLLPNNPAVVDLTRALNIVWHEATNPALREAVAELARLDEAARIILEAAGRHLARYAEQDRRHPRPILEPLIVAARDYNKARGDGFAFMPGKLTAGWHDIARTLARTLKAAALPGMSDEAIYRLFPPLVRAITGDDITAPTAKDYILMHNWWKPK